MAELGGLIALDVSRAARRLGKDAKTLGQDIRTHRPQVAHALELDMRALEPKGRGRIQEMTRADALGAAGIVVRVIHPGAKALNRGAYIRPNAERSTKTGRPAALRFKGVFRRAVRIRATHFFDHAVERAPMVIERAAARHFRRLG